MQIAFENKECKQIFHFLQMFTNIYKVTVSTLILISWLKINNERFYLSRAVLSLASEDLWHFETRGVMV